MLEPVKTFGSPLVVGLQPMPFSVLQSAFDALYPAGLQWYWKADFFNEISDAAIDVHVKYGAQLPTGHSTMHMYPIDGAASRVPEGATSFAYRDGGWAGVIVGVDPDPANAAKISQWARDYWEELHPTSAGGAYVNFMMDEGQDRVRASYRGNYDRLAQVKDRYDPDNVFHVNQNIKPASAGALNPVRTEMSGGQVSSRAAGPPTMAARLDGQVGMFAPFDLLERGPGGAGHSWPGWPMPPTTMFAAATTSASRRDAGSTAWSRRPRWATTLPPRLPVYNGVYLLPLRHPVLVARQLADIDRIAPGRLIFGVGVGGEDRREVAICGVDPATRGQRMNECLAIVRQLLTGAPATSAAGSSTSTRPLSLPRPHADSHRRRRSLRRGDQAGWPGRPWRAGIGVRRGVSPRPSR